MGNSNSATKKILVLGGTGFNYFHHFMELSKYTVADLSKFQAIYAISGGGMSLWTHFFKEENFVFQKSNELSAAFRTTFSRPFLLKAVWKAARGQYPYEASQVLRGIAPFFSKRLLEMPFKNFPLDNFNLVVLDHKTGKLRLLNKKNDPESNLAQLIVAAMIPESAGGLKLFRPFLSAQVSDFEFAASQVKNQFRQLLDQQHSDADITYLNLFREGKRKNINYVRTCDESFPKTGQFVDAFTSFVGLPNSRFKATLISSAANSKSIF